ncbi:MAG TPA: OmpA family protein [Cyclobacteriaceae bacterium]|nr:OmpA family protein [Cyclobacteriaceae bacterium]
MRDSYTSKIDSVASVLKKNSHMNVSIVGHTSADGSSRLNRTLSLKRGKVIARLLIKSGVDRSRITVSGVGSKQPKVIRDAEDYQSMNRRVEVFLRN